MASDPIRAFVQALRDNPPIPSDVDIPEMRRRMEETTGAAPLPDGVTIEPVQAGSAAAEWVRADGVDPERAILYLHGGGYTIGSPRTHRALAARISAASGAPVLVLDYRLAPEHRFPVAVEDATNGYRWLLSEGFEPGRLAIAGDSAGGGLTFGALFWLNAAGHPLPACAVALSPWTDLECKGESMTTKADEDPIVTREMLQRMSLAYVEPVHAVHAMASPIYAPLGGFPPVLIQVGSAEILLDDSKRIAEKARADGVEVDLEVWDDMIHVFQAFAPALPEAERAIERIGEFLRKHLA